MTNKDFLRLKDEVARLSERVKRLEAGDTADREKFLYDAIEQCSYSNELDAEYEEAFDSLMSKQDEEALATPRD